MGLSPRQLREYVVVPAMIYLHPDVPQSAAGIDMVMGTAAHESGGFKYIDHSELDPSIDHFLSLDSHLRVGRTRLSLAGSYRRMSGSNYDLDSPGQYNQIGDFQTPEGDRNADPFVERDVLRAIYARCDLLLLTSDREGYGLPLLEAFAAGKPVVASDIPALRESSGGLATLVPPGSLEEWVAAIERVLTSADAGGALAAERRVHAAARTWDDHVRRLLPVYEEILSVR